MYSEIAFSITVHPILEWKVFTVQVKTCLLYFVANDATPEKDNGKWLWSSTQSLHITQWLILLKRKLELKMSHTSERKNWEHPSKNSQRWTRNMNNYKIKNLISFGANNQAVTKIYHAQWLCALEYSCSSDTSSGAQRYLSRTGICYAFQPLFSQAHFSQH